MEHATLAPYQPQPIPLTNPPPTFLAKLDPATIALYFQGISTYGLLSLNYPTLFASFTLNFAWANFFIVPSKHFTSFITHLPKRSTINDINHSVTGIEVYAIGLGIDPTFLSTLVFFVFIGVCAIFTMILLQAVSVCLVFIYYHGRRESPESHKHIEKWRRNKDWVYQKGSSNWLRLVCNITFHRSDSKTDIIQMGFSIGPLSKFTFWEWSHDGGALLRPILCSIGFAIVFLSLMTITILIFKISRQPNGLQQLYDSQHPYQLRWGVLYNNFLDGCITYLLLFTAITLFKSIVVGFGQRNGLAQVIALIMLEIIAFFGLSFVRETHANTHSVSSSTSHTCHSSFLSGI